MSEQKIILFLCLVAFFVGLICVFYFLFSSFNVYKMLKKAWEESVRVLEQRKINRKTEESRYVALYGEMEKRHLTARVDNLLSYSGMYTRFPNLTAEKLIAVVIAEGVCILLCSGIFLQSLAVAVLITGGIIYVQWQGLEYLRVRRNRKICEELLHCIDLMEIHAYTTESLVEILTKTALQINGPLRSELERTVDDARYSGQTSAALRRLCNRVEQKYMKDLILNLEICSQAKANYKEVLIAAKRIFIQDMANEQKMRKLYQNTFWFTLLLGMVGIFGLNSILSFFTAEDSAFFILWKSGNIGKGIVLYLLIVAGAGLWKIGKRAFL